MAVNTKEIYESVTNAFIESLKKNEIPWQRPWNKLGAHSNYVSGNSYRGVNPMLLEISAITNGFSDTRWLTYKQADRLSFKKWIKKNNLPDDKESWKKYKAACRKDSSEAYKGIRVGEKSTLITFWKRIAVQDKDDDEEKKVIPLLRKIHVFNVEQSDLDIPPIETEVIDFSPIEEAEKIMEEWKDKPKIEHVGDSACYIPSQDLIQMPKKETFHSEEHYYGTLFHEAIHSTGHKSRLNRGFGSNFGDEKYSKEELVAEIGSSFLKAHAKIETQDTIENSEAYVRNWIKALEEDPKMIIQASGKAQRATDFVLQNEYEYKEETEVAK